MFITYTINAPSEVFLLCCWRDEIVDKASVDGDEDDDDVLANAGWYKNMINILNQFNKNYQMKTIKTYIQARRRKFSNNGGGVGLLGGGGGWLLELLLGGVGGVGGGVGGVGGGVGGVGVVGVGVGVVSIIGS